MLDSTKNAAGALNFVLSGLNRGLFNMEERTTLTELKVEGYFPDWLSGVLYRIGPGTFTIPLNHPQGENKEMEIEHWFDGLAQVHRFEMKDGKVFHRSKNTAKEMEDYLREHGTFGNSLNFAQPDPCKTIFGRFMNFFTSWDLAKKSRQNVNITIGQNVPLPSHMQYGVGSARPVVARTDSQVLQLLDPDTLEPLEQLDYSRFDKRLDGQMAASHAIHFDGAFYNFVCRIKGKPQYTVFEIRESGVRILGTTSEFPPVYMHSIQATQRYIILTLWDGPVSGAKMAWNGAFYPGMLEPTGKSTTFCVFDRVRGGLAAVFEGPNFFAFHTINAYDDPADGSIVIDLATVKDWRAMDMMYLNSMRSGHFVGAQATRFRLQAIPEDYRVSDPHLKAHREYQRSLYENIELMTSNPDYYHKPYKYTYGCNHTDEIPVIFSRVVKLDMSEPSNPPIFWSPSGNNCVGEPVFVPRPGSVDEEDGVLLTIVTNDAQLTSRLVCLDAKHLQELGSAEVGVPVPPGFHGTFENRV